MHWITSTCHICLTFAPLELWACFLWGRKSIWLRKQADHCFCWDGWKRSLQLHSAFKSLLQTQTRAQPYSPAVRQPVSTHTHSHSPHVFFNSVNVFLLPADLMTTSLRPYPASQWCIIWVAPLTSTVRPKNFCLTGAAWFADFFFWLSYKNCD